MPVGVNFAGPAYVGGSFTVTIHTAGEERTALKRPRLDWTSIEEAFTDGQPDLFQVLRWDFRLVETLHGRDTEFRNILRWAEEGANRPKVTLISGEGGAGKTRLAATAADELRRRGWSAGFLGRDDDLVEMEVRPKGLFLVIDYPEEQPARINALFKAIGDLDEAPYPVRFLLLSRQSLVDWEPKVAGLRGRFERREIAAPTPLDLGAALSLAREAAERFAALSGAAMPDLTKATAWLQASSVHRQPLHVTAAAIHAVLSPGEAFGLSGATLLHDLALRELHRARAVSRAIGLGDEGLPTLLALGVLADGLGPAAIRALAENGLGRDGEAKDVLSAVAGTPWWRSGRLVRLQPDPIAAPFLGLALFRRYPEGRPEYPTWLYLALEERAASFGNRLARIVYDMEISAGVSGPDAVRPDGERHEQSAAARALDACLKRMLEEEPGRARVFLDVAMQEVPVWAAGFAARIAETELKQARDASDFALLNTSLANHLFALGRLEAALAATEEAAGLYRTLAATRPEAFTRDLAMSLGNLANTRSALGRLELALAAAEEAADLYLMLAASRPETFIPDLARSVDNLANIHSSMGRHEVALALAEEAASLYQGLVAARPEVFTPAMATSLGNRATFLSALGRSEEALAATEVAVKLRRTLAAARPEAFTPDLASSINTLASCLSNLGQREAALATAEEVVGLYRGLAVARPEAFTPDLAMSLTNLANFLGDLGRLKAALATAQEAVGLYRALAATRPEAFIPELAGALNNLANHLFALGRLEPALATAEEAVGLYRALAVTRPDAFVPELATALNNLANHLFALERLDPAFTAAKEAADLYRALAATRPEAFSPDLAMSLNNLAPFLAGLGRLEAALAAAEEAAGLYRTLAATRPDAFTPDLAMSLCNLANVLADLGQREPALSKVEEAADLYRTLATTYPEAFAPDLARACGTIGTISRNAGQLDRAVRTFWEGATNLAPLWQAIPEAHGDLFRALVEGFVQAARAVGMTDEAIGDALRSLGIGPSAPSESIRLFRDWAKAHNAGDLTAALEHYGSLVALLDTEIDDRSLDPARDAVFGALLQLGAGCPYAPPPRRPA